MLGSRQRPRARIETLPADDWIVFESDHDHSARCPRCGSALVVNYDEVSCWCCGWCGATRPPSPAEQREVSPSRAPSTSSALDARVVAHLAAHPDSDRAAIAKAVDANYQGVWRSLKRLLAAGDVVETSDGRARRFAVARGGKSGSAA